MIYTKNVPASPRSKVFNYYVNSDNEVVSSGGIGFGTQTPNAEDPEITDVNVIGTGNTVQSIVNNETDPTTLDVTMSTRMSSLTSSGSGSVVGSLSYNSSTGVLTQNMSNAGSGGTYWGQTPNSSGVVTGTISGTGDVMPNSDGSRNLGSSTLYYARAYANGLYSKSTVNNYTGNMIATGNGNTGFAYVVSGKMVVGESESTALNILANYGCTFYSRSIVGQSVTELSDSALKENIKKIDSKKLDGINLYEYNYKDDESKLTKTGLMAQEVEKVFPGAVYGEEGHKSINYNALVANMAVRITELEKRIHELENK